MVTSNLVYQFELNVNDFEKTNLSLDSQKREIGKLNKVSYQGFTQK